MTRVPREHFAQNEVQKSTAWELLPGVMLHEPNPFDNWLPDQGSNLGPAD